jgi:hypothetical protein
MVELKKRQVVPERPVLALHVLAEEARVGSVYFAVNLGQQVIAADALPHTGRSIHRHRQPYRATVHLGTLRRRYDLFQCFVSGSHLPTNVYLSRSPLAYRGVLPQRQTTVVPR